MKRSTIFRVLAFVGTFLIGAIAGIALLWAVHAPVIALFAPLPDTLSSEGKAAIAAAFSGPKVADGSVAARRASLDQIQAWFGARQRQRYAVSIESANLAGVPVRWIRATDAPANTRLVLMNLHGGGWTGDSGSLTENIPVASITKIPVVAVLYRLAPEHIFPAQVDDALAVYRELLKTHQASEIGIYGTSAGAAIGTQLIARIHHEGLPEPAAFGMFSGDADMSKAGDTLAILPVDLLANYRKYLNTYKATDPLVSPALGPVTFFPPTLCMTSTRDFYLSATTGLCRVLANADMENQLVVFDGLPHAFWSYMAMPESDQAFHIMSAFMTRRLKSTPGEPRP